MQTLLTETTNDLFSPLAVVERKGDYFDAPYHKHAELELIYVKEGRGKRLVGDRLEHFDSGDLVFVGSYLPHEWKKEEFANSSVSNSHAIVAYFTQDVFSNTFCNLRESNKINYLLKTAGRGIKVNGETRKVVGGKMEALVEKRDFERIIALIEILHLLSISDETEYLVYEGYNGIVSAKTPDRLTEVFEFVTTNYNQDITLEEIAKQVYLTPPAFCRFFKQKTNKSFFSYLNEVRISNACKFLTHSSYNISEVAFQCGYKTLSNFNKFFKKSTGLSPKAYREKY